MDVSFKPVSVVLPYFSKATSTGFTLIEVLVALSVMSIGLLGLAALQLQGLRGTHDAALRTQAIALATDTVEHLHANTQRGSIACINTECSQPKLSDVEMDEWQKRLADALPQGEGNIIKGSAETIVIVRWQPHDTLQQFSLSLAP